MIEKAPQQDDPASPEEAVPLVAASEANMAAEGAYEYVSDTVSFMPTDIKVMSSMHHANYKKMIDNRFINYVAIKLRCGVVAMCRTNVLTLCPSVLKDLNCDLSRCLEIMPNSVHAFIKRTRIWVNLSYSYGPNDDPRLLRHTTAHHHHSWLLWARDRPDKVGGVEIYDCCLYENTLRRDWAGLECESDLAYAMVDQKEFFAEMSVTYLSDSSMNWMGKIKLA